MAHLDTLSSYVSTLVGPQTQEKITPSDLAWALEVPSLTDLCCWLARVVEEDQRRGGTAALEKEEREIWDRALSLGVVKNASSTSSSSNLPPSSYLPPSELTEMAALNRSIASVKERQVRQLELNIDRLQRKLHNQQANNQTRLETEAALASEIANLESDLRSYDLLISSTILPTLLDQLLTSLTPHLHPSPSQPLHLTQAPALFRSLASTSQSLASQISSTVASARPEDREVERKELEEEERRLEDVFAKEADEQIWEEEMEKFLSGEADEKELREEKGLVHDLLEAGREKDRSEEVESEVGLLRVAKSQLSSTLLPTAFLLHASLSNDIGKLREMEALLVALGGEVQDLQSGEFEGIGGDAEREDLEEKERKWEDALRLLTSSSINATSPDSAILTQADFLSSISSLSLAVNSSTSNISDHILGLARHTSRTEAFAQLQPLLSHLTQYTPTSLHPLLTRPPVVVKSEVELNAFWNEARGVGKESRFLEEKVGESGVASIGRLIKENPSTAGGGGGNDGSVRRVGR